MGHFSTFAGGVALGIMMIPISVRSTEEFLHAIPQSLREAALALGAPKWKTIVTVVIPAAMRGIVSGTMLDLARVAGETAPLLFTALGNQFWSPGWNQPTATLPVMIFTYAIARMRTGTARRGRRASSFWRCFADQHHCPHDFIEGPIFRGDRGQPFTDGFECNRCHKRNLPVILA